MSRSVGVRAVDGSRFESPDAWIAAVERALARGDSRPVLDCTGIEREQVLAVARAEASGASESGVSALSHERLAELTGLPRPIVLRARVVLIELGLEDLTAASGPRGNLHRQLRHE